MGELADGISEHSRTTQAQTKMENEPGTNKKEERTAVLSSHRFYNIHSQIKASLARRLLPRDRQG